MVGSMIRNNTIRGVAAGFLGLVLTAWVAAPARAGSPAGEAEAFIRELADSGIAMLANADYSPAQRETEFRNLVRKGFALEEIGRFVVGRYWRQMDKDQQADYQEMFAEWLITTYSGRLGAYGGQKIEIEKSTELNNKYNDVVVRTRILGASGQPEMAADWRVRYFDGTPKIIDVIVEGVSMAAAQKSEFESVIRRAGVDGLVENLRTQLSTMVARGN